MFLHVCVLSLCVFTVCVCVGLDVDGIYRVSGNLAVIQKLRHKADHGLSHCPTASMSVLTLSKFCQVFLLFFLLLSSLLSLLS